MGEKVMMKGIVARETWCERGCQQTTLVRSQVKVEGRGGGF